MVAIVKELTIEAATPRVWDALTRPDELAGWWTNDLSVTPEVGSLAEFRFRQGTFVIQFEVAELDQDENVRGISRQGPPQWVGSSVTWRITPVQNGTEVVFTHEGLLRLSRHINAHSGIGNTSWTA